jgi:bifunctional non-homologous end joining protein LigD
MAQARLQKYVEKRDFSKTAEPSGKGRGSSKRAARGRSYLIQKHDASRLH